MSNSVIYNTQRALALLRIGTGRASLSPSYCANQKAVALLMSPLLVLWPKYHLALYGIKNDMLVFGYRYSEASICCIFNSAE